jgi:uncharacterized protein (DUF4213/DUF364 family)
LNYTAAMLDDGGCGVAYNFRGETPAGCTFEEAGGLSGRSAASLLAWSRRLDAVAASVGIAVMNALIQPPATAAGSDVRDAIRVQPGETVGMVGRFGPLLGTLKASGATLHIFERCPMDDAEVHPDWAAPIVLPQCDVVIVSATTVVNRTADALLDAARNAREVVLLGPTSPMVPTVFEGRGVSLLSGVHVTDPEGLMRVVGEGGGMKQFSGCVRKLSVRL